MIELTPSIDEHSNDPIYVQLYRYIRQEMSEGRIAAGAKLPSVRLLAARLGISRTPVALAYDQLQAEGYVRSVPRSGLYTETLLAGGMDKQTMSRRGSQTQVDQGQKHRSAEVPEGLVIEADPRIDIDFGYGAVDWSRFPAAAWKKQLNRCLQPDDGRLFRYGEPAGELELREQIASYLHRTRGVRCHPDSIVIGAGTYQSLDLVLQLVSEADKPLRIASEEAVNEGVKRLFDRHRAVVTPIGLDSDGISTEGLHDTQAQAIYVTPSHQFPVGMTLSAPKRMKLLQWASSCGAFIIENDYDGEFRYTGRPIPALQAMDDNGRVAYIGTFSRALTPSFRLSYAVLPPLLMERFLLGRHSYDQLASPLLQQAMGLFMESGGFGSHMRAMRALYQRKRDILLQSLRESFDIGGQVKLIGEQSGLHLLLSFDHEKSVEGSCSEETLIAQAAQAGIRVYPVSRYWFREEDAPRSTVMLGFGGLSEQEIAEGVRRLGEAWTSNC
ncbi:putative HTH-type transcriptional regulator YhdI [Paenibacillus sp. CCS19]|uniref:MocR-like pyridoxine biosynthesis transcription factor PdxR n=1 Tax=Paenibacillus sp. CCS19 TaxID=3158387 RepID=UPI00256CFDEC|nr:PLP-dependent aminotransferase family protein [Paenibacillus cellulosilyticus]GMK41508.1 putative HTH-type transcriptional regulator YhdI [Paenibacillus cellulosilyticus]